MFDSNSKTNENTKHYIRRQFAKRQTWTKNQDGKNGYRAYFSQSFNDYQRSNHAHASVCRNLMQQVEVVSDA